MDFNHDTSARAIVYGQQKGSIGLRSLSDFHLFGVRFKTGGLFPFAGGTPLREITNRTLDLEELRPGRADQALDQIRSANDFAERVRMIESILSAILRERYEEDRVLNSVLKQLHVSNGNVRIESLAERHNLHNEFKYFAGESPKAFFSREQSLAKLFRQRLKFNPPSGPSPETEAADLRRQ